LPCQTEADSRPRIFLPIASEETFLPPDGFFHRVGPTSQTPYQILVLTHAPSIMG
jgi:hypothetical protein